MSGDLYEKSKSWCSAPVPCRAPVRCRGRSVLIDARQIDDGVLLSSDLVIVGAGIAGISIADRLRSSGLSICLIEGGGLSPEIRTQRMYRGESVGRPYFRLDSCRFRQFGGSCNHWGGACWPLSPIDLERRDWLPWSGWAAEYADLERYYADAAKVLELPSSRFDAAAWPEGMPRPLDMSDSNFDNAIVRYSPVTALGATHRDRIRDAKRVTTLLNANATDLQLDSDGRRIESVLVRTLNGRSCRVQGRVVVLAAGGIENARLLLVSRGTRPAGVGNEHDLVGRFFMEHLHVPTGHLAVQGRRVKRDFYRKATYDGTRVRGLFTPKAEAQARHRLLGCSIAIERASYAYGTPFDGWPPAVTGVPYWTYQRLRRGGRPKAAGKIQGGLDHAWNAARRIETWRSATAARNREAEISGMRSGQLFSLYVRAEQAPNPLSRISLGARKDELGVPQPRLDWRVTEFDTESIRAWLAEFDADVRRRSIGRVIGPDERWADQIVGGPHHMGTTRMSADPRAGVVDGQCRVHSVENLYVTGSSVFTTGGHVNPTFTIVALALRLADELRRSLTQPHDLPVSSVCHHGRRSS
jgi:choline dehydrogenase-like flavoprotein